MRILVLVFFLAFSSCIHLKTDPIKVEPIEIKVDVYITIDDALEDFFRDLDETSGTIEP